MIFPTPPEAPYFAWQYNDPVGSRLTRFDVQTGSIGLEFEHLQGGSFVGVGFNLAEFPAFFDLSPYSLVSLVLETENVASFTVTFKLFVDGITDLNDSSSFRHLGISRRALPGTNNYDLPLNRFREAAWWTLDYNPQMKKLDNRSLQQAGYLLIESSAGDIPRTGAARLVIRRVILIQDHLSPVLVTAFSVSGYYGLFALVWFLFRRHRKTKRVLPGVAARKKLPLASYREQDLERITAYLQTHYSEPGLSLGTMADQLGISGGRISTLIREEFGITFKQQLNRLRLAEAARLLRETDLPIIEIAFAVGYNDRSYFYKVFLKATGSSPREYRKRNL